MGWSPVCKESKCNIMARKKDNTLLTVLAVGVAVYALTRNTTPTPPPMPPPVQPPPGGAFFGYANQAVDLLGNILSTFGS